MKVKANFIRFFCVVFFIALIVSQLNLSMGEVNQQNTSGDQAKWLQLATNAWKFYQAGVDVNVNTGLHGGGLNWPYFTSWDLGTYIQAMLDAKELGILQDDGQWGFNSRVDKILGFLKTRQLTSDGLPYLVYDSRTGEPSGTLPSFFVDEGKLFLALYNLKTLRPDYAQDIDYVVKDRSNNTALIPDPNSLLNTTDLYVYYVALAFKAFEFKGWDVVPSSIIGTIASRPTVTTYDVELPMAHITCEPLLLTKFDVNPQDPRFVWLLSQVYQAQEARYNATGHYTAFSEGNTGLLNPSYVYEFVVDTNGTTWELSMPITPIAYFKVAVGFNAIYNTEYTKNMVDYMGGKFWSAFGFQEGVAEDGRVVDDLIDRTNGLVISAARYAIENAPTPIPSPTPTPTETPSPIPTTTPTPTLTPSETPTSTPTLAPTPTPTPTATPTPTPTPTPIPSLTTAPTTTPPVGWTIEPVMVVVIAVVAALAWSLLFIPLVILWKRTGSCSSKKQP